MPTFRQYRRTPAGLALTESPALEPGPGRAVVRIRAASLNYRDLIIARDPKRGVAGQVPLSDGAGEVVGVGAGVTRVSVGDRVAGCFFQDWVAGPFAMSSHKLDLGGTIDGVLTEFADLSAEGVVRVPDSLSFEEAACLPCAGVTAWSALVSRGRLKPGETVIVLGTGGVSVFALQFAARAGCRVIATSKSDAKLARARQLGAAETINYVTTPDWDKEVLRLTGGRGADHVVETGGGGTLGRSVQCVAPGGHVALLGVLTGFGPPSDSIFPLVARNATLSGIYVGSRADFEAMNRHLEVSAIKPVIDRVFEFDEAPAAFDYLERGEHFGKVVVTV